MKTVTEHPMAAKNRMVRRSDDSRPVPPLPQKEEILQETKSPSFVAKSEPLTRAGQLAKSLIFFGTKTEDVVFDEHTFTLKTLSNKDTQLISEYLNKKKPNWHPFMKAYVLAKALKAIDGSPISEYIEISEEEDSFLKTVEFIDEFQVSLLTSLYVHYEKLAQESENLFKAKEATEEIKK